MKEQNFLKRYKHVLKGLVLTVLFLPAVVILFGQGCGQGFDAGSATSSSLEVGSCTPAATTEVVDKTIDVIPGTRTVSIAYGQELLNSFVQCTGVGTPSQRTLDEWARRNQSLSEYGHLTDMSGAMMMAVAGVAAEVCRDLVDKEKALAMNARGIFTSVVLDGASLTGNEIRASVDMLGLACWQRQATDAEKTEIVNAISQLNVNSDLGAVSLCTAMLSTLASIEQ